jgi:hypothetical protein
MLRVDSTRMWWIKNNNYKKQEAKQVPGACRYLELICIMICLKELFEG